MKLAWTTKKEPIIKKKTKTKTNTTSNVDDGYFSEVK